MKDVRQTWSDHEVELIISKLLRAGVVTAATVVAVGGMLYLIRHGQEPARFSVFQGQPEQLRTLKGVLESAGDFRARAIIQLGLGLVVCTPVARVIFSLFAFVRQRDWLYVAITGVVLGVLVFNLLSVHP